MGANLCCIRPSCAGGPAAMAAAPGDGYENWQWRRLQWRRRGRREKLEVRREKEASNEKKEYMSLEELMLASPGAAAPSELGFGSGGGEFNVSSRGGFKRKVHPARIANGSSLFCEDREYSVGDFSMCKSESGKMKKKVSFRLPEVSDVIVIHSPAAGPPADDVNVGT